MLLFTMLEDRATVNALRSAQACAAHVLKSEGDEQLSAAISALGARRPCSFRRLSRELVVDAAIHDRQKSSLENFTTRELEVAQLIAEGTPTRRSRGRWS